MEALYTPAEVAKKLKVTRRSVYIWLEKGKLSGVKAGHGWRITEEQVMQFLKGSEERTEHAKS